jgi:hypothetical protein
MSGVISLLPHTSSWHDKEQIYSYFYDGGISVTVVEDTLIRDTYFRNLIIDCMRGHIVEVKILGEEMKQLQSGSFKEIKAANSKEFCRSGLYLYLLIYIIAI